jgi:hypothetical protein
MIGHNPSIHLQPLTPEELQDDEMCVVCHMTYEDNETVSLLRCTHYFHTTCIDAWQATQLQQPGDIEPWCPCCRATLDVEATIPDIIVFSMHLTTEAAGGDDFHTPSDQSEISLFTMWAHAAGTPGVKAVTQLLFHVRHWWASQAP